MRGIILNTCVNCYRKATCKKVCKKINKLLRKEGCYSIDFLRPEFPKSERDEKGRYKEIPFSALGVDPDKDPYMKDEDSGS